MAFRNSSGSDENNMMSEINVTPLVDVMLVLLVIFIITAPLLAPQSLKINLPKTESVAHEKENNPQKITLTIDAEGGIYYESLRLSEDALADILKNRVAEPNFQLQIQADEGVNYGRVAQVMAIAQRVGVAKLSFLTVTAK